MGLPAKFVGVVDVPLFQRPGDLNLSDYAGFDANPSFSSYSFQAPLFSNISAAAALDAGEIARIVSIIPNLNGDSETLRNPTQTVGVTGTSFRPQYIDGSIYILNEMPFGAGGLNYRWRLWRYPQTRKAGQYFGDPARFFMDMNYPATYPPRIRIEFQTPPLAGFDWVNYQNTALMPFCWGNVYNRVYAMVMTAVGPRARNLFNTLALPGATWPNFISGSSLAFCRNNSVNSFAFGFGNQSFLGSGFGLGHANYLFVSKGTKGSAYIVNFKTNDYDPDTIMGQEPRFSQVSFDDPVYTAALDNVSHAGGWKNGFIFSLKTNGQGKTGQHTEIVVTDPMMTYYYVLRFVPQNAAAARALIPTNTTWSAAIDTEGTVWFYNGGSPGFKDIVFNSYSPALFFNPRLIDFDLPSITMPCYNTCLPGYI